MEPESEKVLVKGFRGFIKEVRSVAIEVWKWTYAKLKGGEAEMQDPLLYVSSVGIG